MVPLGAAVGYSKVYALDDTDWLAFSFKSPPLPANTNLSTLKVLTPDQLFVAELLFVPDNVIYENSEFEPDEYDDKSVHINLKYGDEPLVVNTLKSPVGAFVGNSIVYDSELAV